MAAGSSGSWLKGFGVALGVVVAVGAIGVLCLIASSQTPNQGFRDASAALVVISATAVGIERVIEGGWTLVGLLAGSWWPLNAIGRDINAFTSDIGTRIAPVVEQANKAADDLVTAEKWTEAESGHFKSDLQTMQARVAQLQQLAPGSERVALVTGAASQLIDYASTKSTDPQLLAVAQAARDSINTVAALAKTFQDNPGRRLISIYVGMLLGLGVASFLGLDLFQAAAASVSSSSAATAATATGPHWTIGLTGLVLGLGSNPTHEVIRAIQEYKRAKKAQ